MRARIIVALLFMAMLTMCRGATGDGDEGESAADLALRTAITDAAFRAVVHKGYGSIGPPLSTVGVWKRLDSIQVGASGLLAQRPTAARLSAGITAAKGCGVRPACKDDCASDVSHPDPPCMMSSWHDHQELDCPCRSTGGSLRIFWQRMASANQSLWPATMAGPETRW
jgi:hypothetical protein